MNTKTFPANRKTLPSTFELPGWGLRDDICQDAGSLSGTCAAKSRQGHAPEGAAGLRDDQETEDLRRRWAPPFRATAQSSGRLTGPALRGIEHDRQTQLRNRTPQEFGGEGLPAGRQR